MVVRRCNRIAKSFPLITLSNEVMVDDKLVLNNERVLFNLFVATKTKNLDVRLLAQAVNSVIFFMKG
jgi:hypothetical protein